MQRKRSSKTKKRIENIVTKRIRELSEHKRYQPNGVNDYAPENTSVYWPLHGNATGLTDGIETGGGGDDRTGFRIRVEKIQFSIQIRPRAANMGTDGGICRFVILKDKNWRNSSAVNYTSYFYQNNTTITKPNFLYNWDNKEQYHVYKDWTHYMVTTSENDTVKSAGTPAVYNVEINPNTIVEYSGGGGECSSIINNEFFLFMITQEGCCLIDVRSRVIFSEATS